MERELEFKGSCTGNFSSFWVFEPYDNTENFGIWPGLSRRIRERSLRAAGRQLGAKSSQRGPNLSVQDS